MWRSLTTSQVSLFGLSSDGDLVDRVTTMTMLHCGRTESLLPPSSETTFLLFHFIVSVSMFSFAL